MADLNALTRANAARWAHAKLTRTDFKTVAQRLVSRKARYQAISVRSGVPWFVIAVIHEREAGADPNFLGNIANGQNWSKRTTIVPIGRGPFNSWEDAAYDALMNCGPFAGKWKDWSAGGTLTLLERYNGLGYANMGKPSPYIWSGTDQYTSGKYIADHVYDANTADKQLGCAGLLLAMMSLDSTISFGAPPMPQVIPPAKPAVPVTPADHGKIGGAVVVATGSAGAVVAANSGVSSGEIMAWIFGLTAVAVAAFIIGYRITKGVWPWASLSTGNQSQELSLPSPQPSARSLELASAQLEVSSAASPVTPLPQPSVSKPRRQRSVKPSRKTPTPRKSSKTSKPSAAKKSSPKRKSKSKS